MIGVEEVVGVERCGDGDAQAIDDVVELVDRVGVADSGADHDDRAFGVANAGEHFAAMVA